MNTIPATGFDFYEISISGLKQYDQNREGYPRSFYGLKFKEFPPLFISLSIFVTYGDILPLNKTDTF